MADSFSLEQASGILGISRGRLRYWNRIGLIKPSVRKKGRPSYDFQDLICLRTAQGLVSQGLPATKIKTSINSLKKKFPGVDAPLADKRVYVFGSRAIISHKNQLIDPQSGQLVLQFDVEDLAQRVEQPVQAFKHRKTSDEWFQEGLRYDRNKETFSLALQAYREALKLDPNFADAFVNMGNIYWSQGKFIDAQRCYRLAIHRDPGHAKAYFNLGNVMDDLDCTQEAIYFYKKSLEMDPTFPDVHFNLAIAHEKLKFWERAIQYWKEYLKRDPGGPPGKLALKRIRLLQSKLARSS